MASVFDVAAYILEGKDETTTLARFTDSVSLGFKISRVLELLKTSRA